MVDTSRPTSVYRYYDQAGLLIYVGITARGVERNAEHNKKARWWPYVRSQKVEHYPSRLEALEREEYLIRSVHPPFNQQHNSGYYPPDGYIAMVEGVSYTENIPEAMPLIVPHQPNEQGYVEFRTPARYAMALNEKMVRNGAALHVKGRHCGHVVAMQRNGLLWVVVGQLREKERDIQLAVAHFKKSGLSSVQLTLAEPYRSVQWGE